MKVRKLLLVFIISIMFIPFIVNAETCENDKVSIESIEIKNISEKVVEKNDPIINGMGVKLDLEMSEVDDSIEYEMTIKNDSDSDYKLDRKSLNIESDYMEYTFETRDKTNVVKAKSSSEAILTIQYKNEVPEELLENGLFTDNKTFNIGLNDGKNDIISVLTNPKTGQSLLILIVLLLVLGFVSIVVLKKNKKIGTLLFLLGLVSLPFSVYALCSINLKVDSKVAIKNVERIVVYRNNHNLVGIGDDISSLGVYYDNSNMMPNNYFLKHTVENNIIKESEICFNSNNELYCIYGGNSSKYEDNIEVLINAFGDDNCIDGNNNNHNYNDTGEIHCSITIPTPNSYGTITWFEAGASIDGNAYVYAENKFGNEPYCMIDSIGKSQC